MIFYFVEKIIIFFIKLKLFNSKYIMTVITKHQFNDIFPVKKDDTKAIVGTIHPHLVNNFLIEFYYGNVGSIWNILNDAFPHHNFDKRESILKILGTYKHLDNRFSSRMRKR